MKKVLILFIVVIQQLQSACDEKALVSCGKNPGFVLKGPDGRTLKVPDDKEQYDFFIILRTFADFYEQRRGSAEDNSVVYYEVESRRYLCGQSCGKGCGFWAESDPRGSILPITVSVKVKLGNAQNRSFCKQISSPEDLALFYHSLKEDTPAEKWIKAELGRRVQDLLKKFSIH